MNKASWSLGLHPHIAAELVWTVGGNQELLSSSYFHQFMMDSDGSPRTVVLEFGKETPGQTLNLSSFLEEKEEATAARMEGGDVVDK